MRLSVEELERLVVSSLGRGGSSVGCMKDTASEVSASSWLTFAGVSVLDW